MYARVPILILVTMSFFVGKKQSSIQLLLYFLLKSNFTFLLIPIIIVIILQDMVEKTLSHKLAFPLLMSPNIFKYCNFHSLE